MKPLKPSARERKRYLFIKGSINYLEKAIIDFIGVNGMSKTGFKFIKKNKTSAIIAINRKTLNEVRAAFCVFPEKISVENVSGSLKKLK